jgi:MFS family permease
MAESSGTRHRRAGFAAFVGTTIEWYDFYVYSTAAALVFGPVFFPTSNPVTALAASFATYAVGYFARPAGAVLFGHVGDRFGRQPALVATLLTMGTATFLTGLLPTYSQIGVWAPVLLVSLRIIQGLAVGGEWGGAVLIAVEHAPARSKTFYGGFVQLGNPAGAILATGVFSILAATGGDSLQQWTWRIPFLISAVLIVFGLYVRTRVEESPLFKHEAQPPGAGIASLRAAVTTNWKPILLGIGMVATPSGGYYILTTYATAYATSESVGLSPSLVLNVMTFGAFCELIVTLPTAWLGDKIGRVRVFIGGTLAMGLLGAPLFLVLSNGSVALIFIAFAIVRLATSGAYAPLATILAQMFSPDARYTSISLSYQISAALFGGLSPLVATLLFGATGTIWAVIGLLLGICALSIVCALCAPQRTDAERSVGSAVR